MRQGSSGNKRKAAVSETAVPAKRATNVIVPEELAALLRAVASSINTATLDLMNVPCTDVAARGRVVAALTESKRQLNSVLGIKKRGASVLAVSDLILDVFLFVRRKELDTLRIVSIRFNAVIETKMSMVCLRLLKSAKIQHGKGGFVLHMEEVGVRKKTRLPTLVKDEAASTTLLLNACQSSRIECFELYGTTPLTAVFFDCLELHAPTIFLKEFCMGNRPLSGGLPHDRVLQALQAFAELSRAIISGKDINLLNCLLRTCFKAGVDLDPHYIVLDEYCDTVENALLEFCFGACDERYTMRKRSLRVQFNRSLKDDFLQRWIEASYCFESHFSK
ncbi:hypothetical protein AAVH_13419 [Aphelenchoides avenae]|nr:hypothetical protein AAVH_13419 [Aphelenchus avenae]